ncbi:MAG: transcriptional repressor [Thermodesulfobacteriota bacterium]
MIRFPFRGRDEAKKKDGPSRHLQERQQFKQVLESYKASRIADRLAVLDIFLANEQHQSLADLEQQVAGVNPELRDRAFLQETMEMFCQFGFAQKRVFESREPVFEHHHLGAHHDHFICTRCGMIQEFVNPELERLQIAIAAQYHFHPLQHKMEIYGLCDRCMLLRTPAIPLVMATRGERVRVVRLTGGKQLQDRLMAMGIVAGVCLEIINNSAAGPFVVAVNDSRIALGAGIAQHVEVTHDCIIAGHDGGR